MHTNEHGGILRLGSLSHPALHGWSALELCEMRLRHLFSCYGAMKEPI
jgi:hypothetical protein